MRFVYDDSADTQIGRAIDDALGRIAERKAASARRFCPFARVRRTIYADGNRVWIGTGQPDDIWAIVEYGSVAHEITPRGKRALSWPGARHPVKRVWHPGTREHAPMRQALYAPTGEA